VTSFGGRSSVASRLSLVGPLMQHWSVDERACVELHYGGVVFPGGSWSWFNRLSMASLAALLDSHSTVNLAVHDLRHLDNGDGKTDDADALRAWHTASSSSGGTATLVLRGEPAACNTPPESVGGLLFGRDTGVGRERYIVSFPAVSSSHSSETHASLLAKARLFAAEQALLLLEKSPPHSHYRTAEL